MMNNTESKRNGSIVTDFTAVEKEHSNHRGKKGGVFMEAEMSFDEMIKKAKTVSVPPEEDPDNKDDLADYL